MNDEVYTVHFTIQDNGTVRSDKTGTISTSNEEDLSLVSSEQPVLGGVAFEKVDAQETGYSLKGAQISITNGSTNPVTVNGKSYAKGEVVMTLTTDENGKCQTADDALPYGTYSAKEVKAPAGYTINTDWNPTFEITKNKEIVTVEKLDENSEEPVISTKAQDDATKDNVGQVRTNASLSDTVTYKNLLAGYEYTFEATLRDASTGDVVKGTDGKDCVVSKTMTASKASGEITMPSVTFDATPYEGKAVVFTEVLYKEGKKAATHNSLTDADQTITFPKLETEASDKSTGTRSSIVGKTTITDKVTMTGLIAGQTYELKGDLVYKEDCTDSTGATHKKGDVIATHEAVSVKADAETMVVNLDYEVDASALAGLSGVVFEDLWHNGLKVAEHHDYDSESQTLNWPSVKTTALDGITQSHNGVIDTKATIVDTVSYTNLVAGNTYKVVGTLMNSDGTVFRADDKTISVSKTFTPTSADGSVKVTFTFDSSALGGKDLVVYEKLYCASNVGDDGKSLEFVEIASHENKDDKNQTVSYIKVRTTAADGKTGDHTGTVEEEATITDSVKCTNLTPGKSYTIKGTLMVKDTGKPLTINGKKVTAEKTFTASKKNQTVELIFTFSSSALAGKSLVVFEDLYNEGIKVAAHSDLADEDQTVHYPKIKTTAADSKTASHQGIAGKEVTIKDTVTYTNLIPGKEYTLKGTLMNAETGKAVLVNGQEVTAEQQFTPNTADGSAEIDFTFSSEGIQGVTTVVFEDLYENGIKVAAHSDFTDEGQTVYIPSVKTTALDGNTKSHNGVVDSRATIVDTVSYTNLVAGNAYKVVGTLMNSDGSEFTVDGKTVTAEQKFTPISADGSVKVTFTFDSSALGGKNLVVYEKLYAVTVSENSETGSDMTEIASHEDKEDQDQTVSYPEIRTSASADGEKEVTVSETTTICDVVTYQNLIPGTAYRLVGTLMNKETGEEIIVNGRSVTAEAEFTPDTADGSISINFTFDAQQLGGNSLVVFENLYEGDVLLTTHADINDADQTVKLNKKVQKTVSNSTDSGKKTTDVKTGDTSMLVLCVILAGASLLFLSLLALKKLVDSLFR